MLPVTTAPGSLRPALELEIMPVPNMIAQHFMNEKHLYCALVLGLQQTHLH